MGISPQKNKWRPFQTLKKWVKNSGFSRIVRVFHAVGKALARAVF
jgi:hypothetical protein